MFTDRKPLKLVGLCGYTGAGKDTVARLLKEHHNFHPVTLSDPMYKILAEVLNVQEEWIREQKRVSAETRRQLQAIGQACRDHICPDVWVDTLQKEIKRTPTGKIPLVTDIRYPNEFNRLIADEGDQAELWFIMRPGTKTVNGHTSEQYYAQLFDKRDRIIHNDGTLIELDDKIKALTI